ncbi:SMP-30/gluconolactonase/LRE family protein [bacterium]|nr:SMP-30/gluconolactonase/LRE family protein [Rubripirellula sp.]MDB4676915.1 SMP-30/gluconolactonase/LRE family protein [bacterium]
MGLVRMRRYLLAVFTLLCVGLACEESSGQKVMKIQLRHQVVSDGSDKFSMQKREEDWDPGETAVIVCDVWDYHHCLNAVRRLEAFAPRLNQVVQEARERGAIIIHAPSDCMEAYEGQPARARAMAAPQSKALPHEIEDWCSQIPSEEAVVYPIDQSDGGEDDDADEHAKWAKELKALGRNPKMPWKMQLSTIKMDAGVDYITDRGDEVWNILESNGIRNVILTGVHVNMCVLGRPFGLRQMARNGKNVVLMRDMTDSMYNPERWPYVSHHEGTRRIISHIERHVCPTITSDQFIGGQPFQFKDAASGDSSDDLSSRQTLPNPRQHWCKMVVSADVDKTSSHWALKKPTEVNWYRSVVKIAKNVPPSSCVLEGGTESITNAWIDGHPLIRDSLSGDHVVFRVPDHVVQPGDYHLLVICSEDAKPLSPLRLVSGKQHRDLCGHWEYRIANRSDQRFNQMPLPAKFGGSADTVFESAEPNWIPRALTQPHLFTDGIEGPACDQNGFVYAVNYQRQGTIGRIFSNGVSSVFVDLPEGSIGNGIRFSKDGVMFVADYVGHQVLAVDPVSKKIAVHAHDPTMNQPNDLAVASDGITLFASDPDWKNDTGKIWRIDIDGHCHCLVEDMGTTNGIEVSPDGSILYVNESKQRKIWKFRITKEGNLKDKQLFISFEDHGFDGMRCDVDGNLYVTRYGKGTVVKLSPQGKLLKEISVLGSRPSNLCFGGPDRRTLYVTEVEYGRLISVRVDRPGRE